MLLDKAIASNSTKYRESIDPDLEFHKNYAKAKIDPCASIFVPILVVLES